MFFISLNLTKLTYEEKLRIPNERVKNIKKFNQSYYLD